MLTLSNHITDNVFEYNNEVKILVTQMRKVNLVRTFKIKLHTRHRNQILNDRNIKLKFIFTYLPILITKKIKRSGSL